MRLHIFLLLILLSACHLDAQDFSLLIHKKSGELQSIPTTQIEELTFVQAGEIPHDKWYFMLENPGVADYLRDFEYNDNDYTYHRIFDYRGAPYFDTRQDWPYGVALSDTVIFNLIPGQEYRLNIQGVERHFWTLGQLRMLKLQGVNNVRDLGGWPAANDKRLRYGAIIRGPELNTTLDQFNHSAQYHQATTDDISTLREDIGIRAELDLRGAQELVEGRSALGNDIEYRNCPHCSTSPIMAPDAAWVEPLQFIIGCLSEGLPVYIHCRWGADRTGLLCMLIEGALGVSESNLAKDFELTSFCGDSRFRTDSRFRDSIAYIKSLEGNSLQDKFRKYWMLCGVSLEDLDTLAALMTE